ncbi:hypothetical protein BH24ACT4_BH24ACT4_02320 [soil metagenome]
MDLEGILGGLVVALVGGVATREGWLTLRGREYRWVGLALTTPEERHRVLVRAPILVSNPLRFPLGGRTLFATYLGAGLGFLVAGPGLTLLGAGLGLAATQVGPPRPPPPLALHAGTGRATPGRTTTGGDRARATGPTVGPRRVDETWRTTPPPSTCCVPTSWSASTSPAPHATSWDLTAWSSSPPEPPATSCGPDVDPPAGTPTRSGDADRAARLTALDLRGAALVEAVRRHADDDEMALTRRRPDDLWLGLCHLLQGAVPPRAG